MPRPLLLVALGLAAGLAAFLAVGLPTTTVVPPKQAAAPAPAVPAVVDEAAPEADAPTPSVRPRRSTDPAPSSEEAASAEPPSAAALAHDAEARARVERRAQPDARKAASYASAWNGIQYRLTGRSEQAAKDLSTEIVPLVVAFREAYQDADSADLDALVAKSDALKAKLEKSGLLDDSLRGQVTRLERLASQPDTLPVLPPAGGPIPGVDPNAGPTVLKKEAP